jgi:FKBP-type peptidyl-prolyl cis-trans isomerase 2
MAQGFGKEVAYIANAHLVFSPANNGTYRLYVTEVDGGLFVVDFTHQINRR